MMLGIRVFFVIYSSMKFIHCDKIFHIETENFSGGLPITDRQTASNRQAVWLKANQTVKVEFCLTKESDVSISDVLVSNDGEDDVVSVLLDWEEIGSFRTFSKSRGGEGWNNYVSIGPVGHINRLPSGRHTVVLRVTNSDKFGIEIDKVQFTINDDQLQDDVFRCQVFCYENIGYEHIKGRDYIASARIQQKSTPTKCTEIDNIKIPFYHRSARSYQIRASHPQYKAFVNIRDPDWTDCEMAIERLWRFDNFTYETNQTDAKFRGKASVLTFTKNLNNDLIVFFFNLRGPKRGNPDSEIGSILDVTLKDTLSEPIQFGYQHYGREKEWSQPIFFTVTPDALNYSINIPDFTWTEGPENMLRLLLPLNTDRVIDFKTINLRKRPLKEDESFRYFDNGDVVVEGIDVDFWWQNGKKMQVKIGDKVYDNADYIRIYEKVPWSADSYAQTFVLYQDGVARLLPLSPPGLDTIPFGSSVLIGESRPNSKRPSANIDIIDIDIKRMLIKILYENGLTANLRLRSSFAETILTITDATYTDRKKLPFLTFMSMWVSDGNSDVDHFSVNGNKSRRIISGWNNLFGTSFVFYRKCLSKHNTLSPDIRIEILN